MTALLLGRRRFLLAGAAACLAAPPARAHDGTVHVVIENLVFVPAEIEVRAGETIEWTNRDRFAHTATVRGGWEVAIPPGKSATHVAGPGDGVGYYCRFHPNMKGRIVLVPD